MVTPEGVPIPEQKPIIPPPDIGNPKKFNKWLNQYINPEHYDRSLDDSTHPDGTPLSVDERVKETKKQFRMYQRQVKELGESKIGKNFTPEKVTRIIHERVQDMY